MIIKPIPDVILGAVVGALAGGIYGFLVASKAAEGLLDSGIWKG